MPTAIDFLKPAELRPGTMTDGPLGRRASQRSHSVLLVARLIGGDADDMCLVRDVSSSGAQIRTQQALRVDDRVVLEFGGSLSVDATVRWVRPGTAGVQFDYCIDVENVLSATTPKDARRSTPRIQRCARVLLSTAALEVEASLIDITPGGGGVTLKTPRTFPHGTQIMVSIKNFLQRPQRPAEVRWQVNGRLGFQFYERIQLSKLDCWLVNTVELCRACPNQRSCHTANRRDPHASGPMFAQGRRHMG